MKAKSNINFKRNYKVRGTIWTLLSRLFVCEFIFVFCDYLFVTQVHALSIFIIGFLNFIFIIWLFAAWINTYYIVSEESISKTKGIFFRKTRTFDISSIASIQVKQDIIGRILGYGNIVFENPLTKKDLVLRHIDAPYSQASLIERQRLNEVSNNPNKKVVPL